jgi:hypothetical protein
MFPDAIVHVVQPASANRCGGVVTIVFAPPQPSTRLTGLIVFDKNGSVETLASFALKKSNAYGNAALFLFASVTQASRKARRS